MDPFQQNPITQSCQFRSRSLVSKVWDFTRRRAVPLGLATTIALALAACAAVNHQQAARDARTRAESDRAQKNAERASAETRQRKEVPASSPALRNELPSSGYPGQFRRDAQRGTATVTFDVPGDRPDEICVIPRHLSFAHYRGNNGAKDRADERRLASYDFYKAGTAESGAIGISPKRTRTSAAVEVYELPSGTSRPEHLTAGYCRSTEKTGKKVAKFKPAWELGDSVRVITGPFADFNGNIESINIEQSKVVVLVNIFGRDTPVELDFSDIHKN